MEFIRQLEKQCEPSASVVRGQLALAALEIWPELNGPESKACGELLANRLLHRFDPTEVLTPELLNRYLLGLVALPGATPVLPAPGPSFEQLSPSLAQTLSTAIAAYRRQVVEAVMATTLDWIDTPENGDRSPAERFVIRSFPTLKEKAQDLVSEVAAEVVSILNTNSFQPQSTDHVLNTFKARLRWRAKDTKRIPANRSFSSIDDLPDSAVAVSPAENPGLAEELKKLGLPTPEDLIEKLKTPLHRDIVRLKVKQGLKPREILAALQLPQENSPLEAAFKAYERIVEKAYGPENPRARKLLPAPLTIQDIRAAVNTTQRAPKTKAAANDK